MNYGDLTKIIDETVAKAEADDNKDFFGMVEFRDRMESEFSRLGFRDEKSAKSVKNILLIRLTAMGDFVNTVPAIREVRKNYPSAHITLVVSIRAYDIAELCPYVNEVISYDDTEIELEGLLAVLKSVGDFAEKYLWKRHFDLGFGFRYIRLSHIVTLLMLYVSGAKDRVSYISQAYRSYIGDMLPTEKNPGNIFLTKPVLSPNEIVHACDRMLYLLKAYNLKIQDTSFELWYDSADLLKAKKIAGNFAHGKLKIAVGISAADPARRYPVQKYLPALKKIIEKNTAMIIFGGSSEVDDAKFLQENLPAGSVLNLTEILPGRRVEAAIISEYANLYIGNFTGTADIAAAAKIPCICLCCEAEENEKYLWGISYYSMFYPYQTKSVVIRPKHALEGCKNLKQFSKVGEVQNLFIGCATGDEPHCITQIEPEEIVTAFNEMIHSKELEL